MIGFWVLVSMAAIFVSTCIIYSLAEQSKENKWRARQEQIDELKKQHKNEIDGLESKINGLNGELQKKNCEIDRLNRQIEELSKLANCEKIDVDSFSKNMSRAFNNFEALNKYYRGIANGRLENAFNTDLTISKISKFNLEAEIISKGEKETNKYNTTFESCDCEDYIHRCKKNGTACKHMLFLIYSFGILQLQPERLKNSFKVGQEKKK